MKLPQERGAAGGLLPYFFRGVRSDAPVIGAPFLDAFLDLLAIEVVLEGLLGELDYLFIRSEAESDELIFREAVDLAVPLGGGERLETNPLFEPDDAVLNFEGVGADAEDGDEHGYGKDDEPLSIDKPVIIEGAVLAKFVSKVETHDDVHDKDCEQNQVKGGVEAGMLLEALWGLIAHGFPSFLSGRCWLTRTGRHRGEQHAAARETWKPTLGGLCG